MKATMESTSRMLILNGLNFRVWEGVTEKGVPFVALVNRLQSAVPAQQTAMISELLKHKDPAATTEPALILMEAIPAPPAPEPAATVPGSPDPSAAKA